MKIFLHENFQTSGSPLFAEAKRGPFFALRKRGQHDADENFLWKFSDIE